MSKYPISVNDILINDVDELEKHILMEELELHEQQRNQNVSEGTSLHIHEKPIEESSNVAQQDVKFDVSYLADPLVSRRATKSMTWHPNYGSSQDFSLNDLIDSIKSMQPVSDIDELQARMLMEELGTYRQAGAVARRADNPSGMRRTKKNMTWHPNLQSLIDLSAESDGSSSLWRGKDMETSTLAEELGIHVPGSILDETNPAESCLVTDMVLPGKCPDNAMQCFELFRPELL
jgi:hypothetical protein